MIALIDYGAGNLTSVRKALSAIGADVWTPTIPAELSRARGVVVPGVGHFDSTKAITPEWRTAIKARIDSGTPLLGICVGLQWLFEGSEEAPDCGGLRIFSGRCFKLACSGPQGREPASRLKVPHVGWNALSMPRRTRLMHGVINDSQVYFTHSFAAPVTAETAAVCEYGVPFSAAVERGHVSAVQFHPEKSGDTGLRILRNWFSAV